MSRKSSRIWTDMAESAELHDELDAAVAQRLAECLHRDHGAAFAVSVRFARERQWSAIAHQRLRPVPSLSHTVAQLNVATTDVHARAEAVQRARHHRIDGDRRAAQAQAEQALADESHRDPRAARVHAPAAFYADRPVAHGFVTGRRIVTVGELRVRARRVAVGLA